MFRPDSFLPRLAAAALVAGTLAAACANGVEVETNDGTETLPDAGREDARPRASGGPGDASPSIGVDGGGSGGHTGPLGGGGGADASLGDAGASPPVDAAAPPVVDAGAPPAKDGGTPAPGDAGGGTVDSGPPPPPPPPTCAPTSPASFTPVWHPKQGFAGACVDTEIEDFYAACMGASSTAAKCSAYAGGLSTSYCYDCIVSDASDATWGPLVDYKNATELNVGGCYAMKGASSACSHAVQYQVECEEAHCGVSCAASDADYAACAATVEAAAGACATYAASVTTSCAALGASAKAACDPTSDARASFVSIANVFCGG